MFLFCIMLIVALNMSSLHQLKVNDLSISEDLEDMMFACLFRNHSKVFSLYIKQKKVNELNQ